MTYDEARLRLLNHSNLPPAGGNELPSEESFLHALFEAERKNSVPNVDHLIQDVLFCLGTVNRYLNGPVASRSSGPRSTSLIDEVAYAVSGIVSGCLKCIVKWRRQAKFDQSVLNQLEYHAYRIAFAWDQVLAGDVDDLLEGADLAVS